MLVKNIRVKPYRYYPFTHTYVYVYRLLNYTSIFGCILVLGCMFVLVFIQRIHLHEELNYKVKFTYLLILHLYQLIVSLCNMINNKTNVQNK